MSHRSTPNPEEEILSFDIQEEDDDRRDKLKDVTSSSSVSIFSSSGPPPPSREGPPLNIPAGVLSEWQTCSHCVAQCKYKGTKTIADNTAQPLTQENKVSICTSEGATLHN